MGACYDVCYRLEFKNELNAVSALSAYIIGKLHKDQVPFNLTMPDAMAYILPQTCYWNFNQGTGEYYAAFDAPYSWFTVLWESFEVMRPWLQDTSTLEIWPDNSYYKFTIEDISFQR